MARRRSRGDEPSINQISVHLLRADVEDPERALRLPQELDRYGIDPASGLSGMLYIKPARAASPPWHDFLDAVADQPLPEYRNQHVSAVMLLQHGGRTFALTFGFGRHLLEPDSLEPDFGLHVAAGLVDPAEVSVIDSRLVQTGRLQLRRQASRGATVRDIGLDAEREMLRALNGRVLDRSVGTRIGGADSLSLAGSMAVDGLVSRLELFRDTYERKVYRDRFPLLDRWRQVPDVRIRRELDADLVEAIARRDRRLELGVPEIIDWRGAGFRFNREPEETRHPAPELSAYLLTRSRPPTLAHLHDDRLLLAGVDSDEIAGSWSVYAALEWESQREDRVFFLSEGRWFEIDADFLSRVDGRLGAIDHRGVTRPDFDPREWEQDYNERLAAFAPGRLMLDRRFAYFEDEAGQVEICDVFTAERDLIHIKRDFEAEGLSHLFAQGAVSAELFSFSQPFRERTRALLVSKSELADQIPIGTPAARSFRVAFGIISDEPDRVPLQLPVFSRVHLVQMADFIERQGFRLTVFGIATRLGARPVENGMTEPERRLTARTTT
jgi:uncharacterized protein (TIGR04141 family)